MQSIRSFLFMTFMYGFSTILGLVTLPFALASHKVAKSIVTFWTHLILGALNLLCGINHEVRGTERIPDGPVLFASKHQAMWETVALLQILRDPAIILKRELMRLPIYGWFCAKIGMIAIDRSAGSRALRSMIAQSKQCLSENRELVIFPQGTRIKPGADAPYQSGVAALYKSLNVPCVPIALNSGLFWRKGEPKRAGTVIVEFLEPIEPGLGRKQFMARLKAVTEAATDKLVEEGMNDLVALDPNCDTHGDQVPPANQGQSISN